MKKVFVILVFLLASCTSEPAAVPEKTPAPEPVYAFAEAIEYGDEIIPVFHTTVKLETLSQEDMDLLYPVFNEKARHFSRLFDRYHSYEEEGIANIYTINHSEGVPVHVEAELYEALQTAADMTVLTNGKYNLTVGRLFDVWADLFSPFPIEQDDPDPEAISDALGCVVKPEDLNDVLIFNDAEQTVTLMPYEPCGSSPVIDAGALAKGYASEKIFDELKQYGRPFLLNAGSSSIAAYAPDDQPRTWYVGARNPYARVYTLYDFAINNTGMISTSGDDSSYFILKNNNSVIRHHILDPDTGYPNNYIRTNTVMTDHGGLAADVLTTALFNCETNEERLELIRTVADYFDIDIAWSWFIQTGEEQGILYTSESFRTQIVEASVSENIIKTEVLP
ncbi:MAG: FAD:protein FMN transferase [Solobacterium sp.]|nr:FAD:protein FMN transferase [Solobacterium sp.]